MQDYEKEIENFINDFNSVINEDILKLSMDFDKFYKEQKAQDIEILIKNAKSLLSDSLNKASQMQIYYDISGGYHDLRIIENQNNENYLENEIYYLRYVLDIYEKNYRLNSKACSELRIAKYIAMRSYTNLGNAYRAIRRYIASINCFQNALILDESFAMASLNLSDLLFEYAQFQIKGYEKNYFDHACYYYYSQTINYKFNLENQKYLDKLNETLSVYDKTYIKEYLTQPLNLPSFNVYNEDEYNYRIFLRLFRLFLDPCQDILSDLCFAVDSINLPFVEPLDDKQKEFVGLFNQIKQEFNWARFMWYQVSAFDVEENYPDKELDLIDVGDCADYSLKDSMMRTAFKTCYSLFDRIGFFINEYFEIGLTEKNVNFKNVWKENLRGRKGNIYFSIPFPIMKTHFDNPFIQAMYWLQKDFYEKKEINVTAPQAFPIFQMRNDMEHNCLRTAYKQNNKSFTKYTSEGEIEQNTFQLLKLGRESIIYLCLAINYDINIKQ